MRVLIVDDSPTARAQARIALEDAVDGLDFVLEVDEAAGGVEALRVLATTDVSILVVDLHMPDVHGLEVLRFWRSRTASLGVACCAVVVSTEVSVRDRERAREHGAVSFCDKPLTGGALRAALATTWPAAQKPVAG